MAATTTSTTSNTNALPSAWAQVVKGGATGESPDIAESSVTPSPNIPANDGNVPKKTAWNTPISHPVAQPPHSPPSADHQPAVMGAAAWPALSDSARLNIKSSVSSSDSPKSSSDSSAPVSSQGTETAHSLQPLQPKQGSANLTHNSMNSAPPTRQRSMKRGGGGNRQGGFARVTPPSPLPVSDMAHTTRNKTDSSSGEIRPSGGFTSQSNLTNENSNHKNSNRRGNFGHHGRGEMRNNYHGGRRDHDHGNYDWNSSSSHGRGAHGHHHRPHGRGFMPPPVQVAPSFVPPLPVRPFSNLVYSDAGVVYYIPTLSPESFRNGPFIPGAGPPPPFFPYQPDSLHELIVKQIEYYFSDDNLVKDAFLRSKMDEQGWVSISLIANFPRVQQLSDSIPFILDCLSKSSVVEVQGDKIRRRNDWMKWCQHMSSNSISDSQTGSHDNLINSIEGVSLEENQAHSSTENVEKEKTNNLRVSTFDGSVQGVC